MNVKELKEFLNGIDDDVEVANAIKKGIEKGSLYSMETLLSRVYGSPKQEVDQTIKATLNIPNLPDIGARSKSKKLNKIGILTDGTK